MFILSTNKFNAIQSVSTLEVGTYTRRTMKVNIIDKIQAALPDIRWNRMKKVNIVIDEIIYKLTDRGFSYNGRVTLAKKLEVGLSTVDKAFSLLKQTGLFVFAYRENPASNSAKTPVIFYVKHEKYKTFESMVPELQDEYIEQGLSRIEKYNKQDEEQKEENGGNAWESKNEGGNIFSTNIFTKKQDLIINKKIAIKDSFNKIIQYVAFKVNDRIEKGANIEHMSSYVEKVFKKEERQARIEAEKAQQPRKQRQNVQAAQKIDFNLFSNMIGFN